MADDRPQAHQRAREHGSLAVRVATVVVGLPLFLGALYLGGWVLFAVVALLSMLGFYEYVRMWWKSGTLLALLPGLAGVLAFLLWAQTGGGELAGAAITFTILLILAWQVLFHARVDPAGAMLTLSGSMYTGWLFSHVLLLRGGWPTETVAVGDLDLPMGFALVMFALLCTWATDTGAYFAGRAIGGPKLAPKLSPAKTISGAVAGTLVSVAVGITLGSWLRIGGGASAALGLLTALAAQVGDLVESALKRHVGVKDSGAVLPGHGGVLDRFDSTLFTAPAIYYALRLWLGF